MSVIEKDDKIIVPEDLGKIIISKSELKTFNRGEIVFGAGDKSDAVYLIKNGSVKVCHFAENGTSITLLVHEKGELFGAGGVIDEKERAIYAVASSEKTQVYKFAANKFMELMEENHKFALFVARVTAKRLRIMDNKILWQVSIRANERICVVLFDLAVKNGTRPGECAKIKITQQELSEMLGTCRQTTTTMLQTLKKEGLITNSRGYIIVKDLKALQERAFKSI